MGYLQHVGKSYYRIRHYIGLDPVTKKPRFEYHKQSIQYVENILNNKKTTANIDLIDQKTVDLNLNKNDSFSKNELRGCPSLVGGRPAKPVVSNGRVGSNPTPRAILFVQGIAIFLAWF